MHGHLSLVKLCSVSAFTSVLTTGGGWCGGLVASARVRAAVQDASLGQAGHRGENLSFGEVQGLPAGLRLIGTCSQSLERRFELIAEDIPGLRCD